MFFFYTVLLLLFLLTNLCGHDNILFNSFMEQILDTGIWSFNTVSTGLIIFKTSPIWMDYLLNKKWKQTWNEMFLPGM